MTTDEISERLFAARDHWRQTQTLTADETRFLLGAVSQLLGQVEHLENYCDEECLAAHKTRQPPKEVRFFVMDGSGKTTELPPAVKIDMGGKTVSEVVQSWKDAARARRERGEGDTPGI
jgi:hypothetical protein